MTRKEKVNLLNELLEIEEKNDIGNLTSTDRREFQQWIEDLEQEPILDKIRAEMKPYTDPKGFIVIGENRFNMILDKYKGES